jgi:hypothetical protein
MVAHTSENDKRSYATTSRLCSTDMRYESVRVHLSPRALSLGCVSKAISSTPISLSRPRFMPSPFLTFLTRLPLPPAIIISPILRVLIRIAITAVAILLVAVLRERGLWGHNCVNHFRGTTLERRHTFSEVLLGLTDGV